MLRGRNDIAVIAAVHKELLLLQILSSQQILSAPVVACSEGDAPDDCTDVIGFIDIRDVLVSFLSRKLAL